MVEIHAPAVNVKRTASTDLGGAAARRTLERGTAVLAAIQGDFWKLFPFSRTTGYNAPKSEALVSPLLLRIFPRSVEEQGKTSQTGSLFISVVGST